MQDARPILTRFQVVARIAVVIMVAEMLVMFGLESLPFELSLQEILAADALALLALTTLPIYLLVIKPFADAHERSHEQVTYMAYHDALTGLPNRRLFFSHLERALAASARHRIFGALLLIDLDEFKAVNDNFGHEAGDALLVEVARRLESGRRHEDVAGRLGGDEFVVLVQQLDSDQSDASRKAQAIAENLRRALCQPVTLGGKDLCVELSIGIRLLGPDHATLAKVLREADAAMYRAKKRRRGVRLYRPGNSPSIQAGQAEGLPSTAN